MYRLGEGDEFEEFTEVFEQPLYDALKFWAFNVFWLAEFKIKPISKLSDLIEAKILRPRHERKCNDDCGRATKIATKETIRTCTRMPFSNELDIKHYLLDSKNNTEVVRS